MRRPLSFIFHVIRALGLFAATRALIIEWARPYVSVHERYEDGSRGPWVDGFRAWRWAPAEVPAGHVAVPRPLERAFSCLLPVDF